MTELHDIKYNARCSSGHQVFHVGALLGLLLFLMVTACQKPGDENQGEVLLSSEFDFETSSVQGFNFETGTWTRYPSQGELVPDIIADVFRRVDGTVKPGFTSPSNSNGFSLAGAFESMGKSQEFFDNELITVDTTRSFNPSSDTVREYQVWVLKTSLNKYVKLHVKETSVVTDPAGEHLEVLFDYYYQPDGSATFPQ